MTSTARNVPSLDPRVLRRRELAAFLRSRRERLTPEQVGLLPGGRRRTPGLRREEVAQAAGVGVTWYTWLEQGRDIRASEQVLRAISTTLQLDPNERAHLFTLAGVAEPAVEQECQVVSEPIRTMLAQLDPLPASVQNARMDILAVNRGFDLLLDGVSGRPFEERNSLVLAFARPDLRERLVDWETAAPRMVAQYRAAMAGHVAEPAWKSLVCRLRGESPEFERMWNQHEVRAPENHTKRFLHPDVGLMRFNYTHLWFGRQSEVRLITYTPTDGRTLERLRRMFDAHRQSGGGDPSCRGRQAGDAGGGPLSGGAGGATARTT